MPDGGWRVTIGSGLEKKLILDLDEDGESAECIPWNDDLEETYAPKPPDPEPVKQKEKGFFADMWDALREGWREGKPPAPEPAAQKKVTDSMIEGVKKASEARGQKTREDIEKRQQRALSFHRAVVETLGEGKSKPKNTATTGDSQHQEELDWGRMQATDVPPAERMNDKAVGEVSAHKAGRGEGNEH